MARRPINLDHIPPEHHEGMGLVANSWSNLEGAVERLIWRLARIANDNRGIAITTHMGIRARMDAACALAEAEFPESPQTEQLKKLSGHITGELYGLRNEILHSRLLHFDYAKTEGHTIRSTYKARGTIKREAKLIDPQEYAVASKKILETATKLREILSALSGMIAAKDSESKP